ncbi:hypothetical protein H0A58_03385 [Alcaligenaceae bacterium]|nr:hypothetical protein [Alcaligenaceae bacterium]
MKSILAAISLVLLAACQTPDSRQAQSNDYCGASSRQNLVGSLASSIDQSALSKATRVIHPGTAVTRDYRQGRLNIYVDDSGKVERVNCG